MATEQEPIEIPLGGGPSQATGRLFRGPNVLEINTNGDHDRAGYLVKARGFTRIPLTTTTHGDTPESVFVSLGVMAGELLVVGRNNAYAVAAPAASIDGATLVLRGPSMVGAFEIGTVHSSALGIET